MDVTDPREKSDKYRKHMTVRFNNAKQFEFATTQFIIDEQYVGNPPKVQISIENLNDNIDENFLRRDLEKLGRIRTLDIVRHPETRQHLGLARVQFEDPKIATCCVETFNGKQVMGKQLCVYHDVRFAIIERKKEEKMRPQPVINQIEQPKIPVPTTPIMPVFAQLPFPPVISPSQIDALPRLINRQHASLDERLARLGLKQAGPFPPITPPTHQTPDKLQPMTPFMLNHTPNSSQEKRPEAFAPTRSREEEERDWNPIPTAAPSPLPSPVEEIILTLVQINDTVIPFIRDKFIDELKKNLHSTLMRRLVYTYGYPYIDEAQRKYREEKDIERLEEAKREAQRKQLLNERKYFNKDKVDLKPDLQARPRANMIRQRVTTQHQTRDDRITDNDLRRKNRSATLAQVELVTPSEESQSDDSLRESRSLQRKRRYSGSRSNSRSSRESSSSFSRDSSTSSSSSSQSDSSSVSSVSSATSHHSSSSSQYSESHGVFKMETDAGPIHSQALHKSGAELEAASALASLSDNLHTAPSIKIEAEEPSSLKPIPKKRKKKDADQENQVAKRLKEETLEHENNLTIKKTTPKKEFPTKPKPAVVFQPRSRDMIEKMNTDLYSIDDEDLNYLMKVHQDYEEQHESTDQTRVPFGSMNANKAHLLSFRELNKEMNGGKHPGWWNGCSRCSHINKEDRGRQEEKEDNQEDQNKAPIKQAAVSTRRDQRSDQRRMATLNPEIDPALLKQLTLNTLQMRAKNLRFSRSRIHQWGLFACEKIASGDAVIEYVGEKIRHSVADHRELVVYPETPGHDGSSYFFRVDTDVIDASFKGNKARFINHSCQPNCIAKIIKHDNGTNSIVIYAKQVINEDDEITYDYKFPIEADATNRIRCRCRAPKCHIWLN